MSAEDSDDGDRAKSDPQEDPNLPPKVVPDKLGATLPPTESNAETSHATVGDQVRYFGDYELLEEIARGGMGLVFRARQMNLNRTVALKMILAGKLAGEEDVQRFHTEAEAAARLDHPGIVPIFEIGQHSGQHYFSMGYIEGENLAHKLADGPLPPREATDLVNKICEAMAYSHEHGVIHRDLKPANILIDAKGQPKVTDFGLAKKTEADSGLTGTGQILGTPAFMAPEQAMGRTADVGPLSDVYSLGAILYCLLTGRPPFQAASPMETLLQVQGQEPVSPHLLNVHVPQDLETICLKCLSKIPDQRYASARHLSEDLQRYLDGRPIVARPAGYMERMQKWLNREPIAGAAMIGCILVVLIGPFTAFCVSGLIAGLLIGPLVAWSWRAAFTGGLIGALIGLEQCVQVWFIGRDEWLGTIDIAWWSLFCMLISVAMQNLVVVAGRNATLVSRILIAALGAAAVGYAGSSIGHYWLWKNFMQRAGPMDPASESIASLFSFSEFAWSTSMNLESLFWFVFVVLCGIALGMIVNVAIVQVARCARVSAVRLRWLVVVACIVGSYVHIAFSRGSLAISVIYLREVLPVVTREKSIVFRWSLFDSINTYLWSSVISATFAGVYLLAIWIRRLAKQPRAET